MENKFWKSAVGSLIGAIWLYTLADIAGSITETVNGILNPGGILGMFSSFMGDSEGAFVGTVDILGWLFALLVLFGYFLFYSSLSRFMRLQRSDADRMAVGKVRKAYIQLLVAILIGFIPLVGKLIALVLTIVAYATMISGYRGLRDSGTCTEETRQGAARLRAATIWILVGYIIGCLPFGSAVESLISFITFFVIISGWGIIRRGAPELSEEETTALKQKEVLMCPRRSTIPVWWFPTFIGLSLILSLVTFLLYLHGWEKDKSVPFSFQQIDYQTFGELTIGQFQNAKEYMYNLALIGLCIYAFFAPKVVLSQKSRIGICLMITSAIIGLGFIYLYLHGSYISSNLARIAILTTFFRDVIGIIGLLMFIWTSLCSRLTKVSITVLASIQFLYPRLSPILLIQDQYKNMPLEVRYNTIEIHNTAFNLTLLALTFIIVLIAAIRSRHSAHEPVYTDTGYETLNK